MQEQLRQLAQMKGIETEYVDAWGKAATVHQASEKKILKAMGYNCDNSEELQKQLKDEETEYWHSFLDPVLVSKTSQHLILELRLPIEVANESCHWEITTECQQQFKGSFTAIDGELVHAAEVEGNEYHLYKVNLPELDLPLGYHNLELTIAQQKATDMRIIVTPESCFKQQTIAEGKKVWGLSVQLYCVRSENNWGVGDFSDLSKLVKQAAHWGADFVGLNPIHSLYPSMPDSCSPYSPSSRRWLNTLYLDVTAIDGFAQCSEAQTTINSDDFKRTLEHARNVEYVDYSAVAHIKYPVLRSIFNDFYSKDWLKNTSKALQLQSFIDEGGDSLQQIATYDAIQYQLFAKGENAWGWPVWEEAISEYHKEGVFDFQQQHQQDILFYCYLQWLAAEQLEKVQSQALNSGMDIGIYRDLAVGVSSGSAEIWANRDLYCSDASVGAPPDVLGPLGQNWGLPPMNPTQLHEQAYQPIIDLFRANMQSCGALRLDHVMALLRLWWVPEGDSADKGAYVYYPVEDLLSILALESQRNECLIIGEDLGTVPDGIVEALTEKGIHSYRVFFFEQAEDGGFFSPGHYPEQAMATLTTHDMPTLNGYWHCDDLALGKEVGLYPDEEVLKQLYSDRHNAKQRILDSLHGHAAIPDSLSRDVNHVSMTQELNFGMQQHMATGTSSLLSLQLEDWLQMDKPVNIPGTYNEYPNWRRKLSTNLEQMAGNMELLNLAEKLTQARATASK